MFGGIEQVPGLYSIPSIAGILSEAFGLATSASTAAHKGDWGTCARRGLSLLL